MSISDSSHHSSASSFSSKTKRNQSADVTDARSRAQRAKLDAQAQRRRQHPGIKPARPSKGRAT